MYQCIVFPQTYAPFKQEGILASTILAYELLTYPIDFIASRCVQREILTSKSLIQEPKIIYQEVQYILYLMIISSHCGIYYGLKSRIDMSLSKIIIRYYLFNYLYFRFAFKNYVSPKFREEQEDSGFDITPENSTVYPLLRYAKIMDPLFLSIAAFSNLIGMIASHPINILRIRLQNEILQKHQTKSYTQKMIEMTRVGNGHMMWFKTGFASRFFYTYTQFILEMGIFQYCLKKLGYEFMNVFRPKKEFIGNTQLLTLSIFGSSILTQLILQPFYFYSQRNVYNTLTKKQSLNIIKFIPQIYQKEGIQGLFKGYLENTIRSISRNTLSVGVLWYMATQANKERFKPEQ